ncbi:hypothetical protein PSTG_01279 [Puccinia striiformis f. sp. tritici PST-78]|uniref:Uncharacterized protein n=1 Tax=Puccinia striiformis f. sp. tritici PST-78 TaxID=1165861 RepID=A0A0L0W1U8_9BASI|nr:hypothetical protein PSTG_01279 [Puccinia striiformis f. sp. tritici PST-78]
MPMLQPIYLVTHVKSLIGKEFKIFLQAACHQKRDGGHQWCHTFSLTESRWTLGAFNMIASAISHSRQPTKNTPALHFNPTVSALEEALNVCAKRFLDKVSDETYAGFILVLKDEKKAQTFLVISRNDNNDIVLRWLENHTREE